jgi:hypothetical protein
LASAFDRVMNPRDWKAPIRCVIPANERQLVEKAIHFFTESPAEFEVAPGTKDLLVVKAPGYRAGPREGVAS